jgi:hypothetical protein
MPSSTSKRVLLLRFDGMRMTGLLNYASAFSADGIELLSSYGQVTRTAWPDIKCLAYVIEDNGQRPWKRNTFTGRPRGEGLWTRLVFRDDEELEVLLSNRPHLWDAWGLDATCADATRVYVPRAALKDSVVLGVVGTVSKAKASARSKATAESGQQSLFEDSEG